MLKTVGGVIAAVLAIATTALLVVAVLPGLFGLEQAQVVVQLSAFRLLVAIAAAGGALLCLVTAILVRGSRRVLPAILAVVLAAVSVTGAVVTANRGIDDQMVAGEATDLADQVTVLAWNTLGDAVDPGTIAAIAVREGADVVSLPETSSDTAAVVAAAMTAAGRPMVAHSTDADAGGTSLLISTGLGEYAVRAPTATGPTAIDDCRAFLDWKYCAWQRPMFCLTTMNRTGMKSPSDLKNFRKKLSRCVRRTVAKFFRSRSCCGSFYPSRARARAASSSGQESGATQSRTHASRTISTADQWPATTTVVQARDFRSLRVEGLFRRCFAGNH